MIVIVSKPVVVLKESVKNKLLCLSKESFDAVVLKLTMADQESKICCMHIGTALYIFDFLVEQNQIVLVNFSRLA